MLGGGDGLAVREILKYPQVEIITLVDLDPEMTGLFTTHPMLTALNQKSFQNSRVHIINADAFPWVDSNTDSFDFIVIDFPDPTNSSREYQPPTSLPAGLRFMSVDGLPAMFQFPPDMSPMNMPPNRLNDQVLVRAYDQDWKDISH